MGTTNPTGSEMTPVPPTPETPPVVPDVPPTEPPKPAPPEPAKAPKDWEEEAAKWKSMSRRHEDASKANADKAKQFDALQESAKTDQQKSDDRAAAAEAKVAEFESRALRAEVGAAKGVPAALLSGATKEELEASADALLTFRGEKPKPDFGGGNRGGNVTDKPPFDDQIAEATKAGNFQLVIALKEQRAASLKT